ncbi:MAG: cytochrome c oxidase subunit II [Candidatus Binatus sp.]|uniref:cytochrome c oxidase subunit II n=1 Tax=Candidatus Binatus sp. TaxID=2811406 RepID=UPI00271D6D62|nr:cytochrome c oxidase subunit II [Candidatus Binatus sp.]MDO8432392.1 cytochrome c oxidase subunit II [Candidatus Binatus sp.]
MMMKRWLLGIAAMLAAASRAFANDWGMGDANSKIPPSSIFSPVSTPASDINTLAFFTLAITGTIFLIVGSLIVYSVVRFRARSDDDGREPPQVYGSNPIEFAWTTVPAIIVFVLILITARTIYTVQAAPRPPGAINVRVIGHQWWWEFQYPDLGIVTANELHVPQSDPANPTPTFIVLESADVAHSFWVPRLAGKTDAIPNHRNTMWIDPHEVGTFLGQCAEFCGTEHAMMLLRVIVEPRGDFQRWAEAEKQAPVQDASVARGRAVFESTACVNCHAIRGTAANGTFGPDLTHLMSRETLGAGVAINTPEHLKIWVHDPAEMKPGALMPAMNLEPKDLDGLVAYLATLR